MQLAVVFSLSYFSFCLFLRKSTAFCTTLPFQFSCQLIIFSPKYSLLVHKNLLFNGHFALFCRVFNGFKRFCLYHCSGFLCFSTCIQQHLALHLAAFYLAFCTKTHCIQHQNALRLAAYCTAFSIKNALHFAANCPKSSANGGVFK